MNAPELSVIIPTRDRPEWLDAALESITAGSLPPGSYEVIVADNDPGGETAAVVALWNQRFRRLLYLPVHQPGLHAARHAGALRAQADLLVYCDDDIVADPDWLASIRREFADPSVWLVGGNNLPLFEREPPRWLQQLWQASHKHGARIVEALSISELGPQPRDIRPQQVFGCNYSVRSEVLRRAGGFHPDGFPREMVRLRGDGESHVSAFVHASGGRARFTPGATVRHRVSCERMSLDYFRRRYFAEGVSDSYAAVRRCGQPDPADWRAASLRSMRRGLLLGASSPALIPAIVGWWMAYRAGFRFHQREVARDSTLLAWVTKPNYW